MLSVLTASPDMATLELGFGEICLRLLCAMAVGMIIGTEREYTHRPAGMRTHILVALGACAVMITGQLIFIQYKALGGNPDPSRLSAQVITGVGFLGAGTILREGTNVKGLTTAASLWAVACLGIAAGGGYYFVALAGMVFIFITLTIFEVLQNKLIGPGGNLHSFQLEIPDVSAGLALVSRQAKKHGADIREIQTQQLANSHYAIRFLVEIGGVGAKKRRKKLIESLAADPAVVALHLSKDKDTPVL